MKRHGNLWDRLVSWDNLLVAARKAQRGKRSRPVVRRFNFVREWELLRLQRELRAGSYRPGEYCTHWIARPKRRLISAAPYRDRVLHHALMNVLEPIFDGRMHHDSYACRKGKGTHAASRRLQQLMRRNRFAVQFDIRKFFPSIDHQLLKAQLRRVLKDGRVLELLDRIVDRSNEQEPVLEWFPGDDLFAPLERRRGLPIGNLTSQWLANWYLTGLDHMASRLPGVGGYVRYCDDFVLLSGECGALAAAIAAVRRLLTTVRLRLHESKLAVTPVRAGLTFVGYRTWSTRRLLPKSNLRRCRRRLRWLTRAAARGELARGAWQTSWASWLGHARQANTLRVVARVRREWARRALAG